jgi:hypothetical protein
MSRRQGPQLAEAERPSMRPVDRTESMLAEHDRHIHAARLERLGEAADSTDDTTHSHPPTC